MLAQVPVRQVENHPHPLPGKIPGKDQLQQQGIYSAASSDESAYVAERVPKVWGTAFDKE
jgi:hypothetical protein